MKETVTPRVWGQQHVFTRKQNEIKMKAAQDRISPCRLPGHAGTRKDRYSPGCIRS